MDTDKIIQDLKEIMRFLCQNIMFLYQNRVAVSWWEGWNYRKSHVKNEMSKMNLPETVPAVV